MVPPPLRWRTPAARVISTFVNELMLMSLSFRDKRMGIVVSFGFAQDLRLQWGLRIGSRLGRVYRLGSSRSSGSAMMSVPRIGVGATCA